jgi:hypothetical protein
LTPPASAARPFAAAARHPQPPRHLACLAAETALDTPTRRSTSIRRPDVDH